MLGSVVRSVFEDWGALLGSSSVTFFGQGLWLRLVKSDVDPSLDIDLGALVEADFDGYAAQDLAAAIRVNGYDPATGELLIIIPPTDDGNHWETASDLNLPQTIYAVAIIPDVDGHTFADSLAVARLPQPIELVAANQGIDVPLIRVRINPAAVDGM